MELSGVFPIFACACFGGLLIELLKWYQLRESPNLPTYATSPLYWSITALMALASGVLAVLYGTGPRNAIMILNIGVSAPLIIRSLAEINFGPAPIGTEGRPPTDRVEQQTGPPRAPGFRQDAPPWVRRQTRAAQDNGPSIAAFLRGR